VIARKEQIFLNSINNEFDFLDLASCYSINIIDTTTDILFDGTTNEKNTIFDGANFSILRRFNENDDWQSLDDNIINETSDKNIIVLQDPIVKFKESMQIKIVLNNATANTKIYLRVLKNIYLQS
jgi:hypothetical protein